MVNHGLEGVVAAETRLSMVDGQAGELIIAGHDVAELAGRATFEETVGLLMREAGQTGVSDLHAHREIPEETVALLRAAAKRRVDVMDALRMAAGTLIAQDDAHAAAVLIGTFPTIVAAYWRLLHEREPLAPRRELGHAANYLYMLTGELPGQEQTRGMETYLNTVVDHGLNASTFTARVIASTGSDFVSAIAGAIGALKGPLHGGAPGPALDMVFEIGDASRAEPYLRAKIEAGEKLMGFGHRVYKVRDPRADVLSAAAERMFSRGGDEDDRDGEDRDDGQRHERQRDQHRREQRHRHDHEHHLEQRRDER
ncbi:MAG TPA: citrate/2-methylcitrate synthase, partial [Thermoanaerobaculia bacterium]